ncbi:unnamed protein product [Adineta ricciae]|uniref:Chloride channel CLIC-like protein 1 n=1 Tax=Adineta ricciae TaxID=249248 RepID=A0A814US72_ADIRI|nr:unnamed protein product [Adineta ricciae]CAF1179722.1 unnamed protein product [Adineta ricciae]
MIVFIVGSHSQDIFDIFNNAKDQVVQKVDYASTKVKEKVRQQVLNLKDGETCPPTHTTEYRTVLAAYRHVIKDWLEKFPSQNSKDYRLLIDLSSDDINRLNEFATSNQYEQKDVLHQVHMVSDILKHMVYEVQDTPLINSLSWSNWIRSFNINTIIKSTLVLLAIGVVSFISIRTHLRRGRWFTTFVFVAFIVSVMQNWYTLYQEAQAKVNEVLMKKLPKHCQGQSMGFFDMIAAKLGRFVELPSNECREYHIAMQSSPHLQVTPIQAISMTFAQLFTTPLGAIGESLSQFFAGTMRHVPFVLWPVIILLIIFIAIVVMLMYSRYEVHLPFMMGSLRPSPHPALPQTTPIAEPIEGSTKETANQVRQLQHQVESLKLELAKQNLSIEHQSPTSTRSSRPSSVENPLRERERSQSNQRSNREDSIESGLRQRSTPNNIGFKQEFLPD